MTNSTNRTSSASVVDGLGLEHGLPAALHRFERLLKDDQAIAEVEQRELDLRHWLRQRLSETLSASDTRRIVRGLAAIGFIRKYKPYAIKAASPAGYSLFIQRPGQGFSLQRHLESKDEIFHILEVLRGRSARGYVFLCTLEEWDRFFRNRDLSTWIRSPSRAGKEFRARCFRPEPGDLFCVNGPDIVHTVIGCVLEEFATSSCDHVDRLFDQNASRRNETGLDQANDVDRLSYLERVFPRRRVTYSDGTWHVEQVEPQTTAFGYEYSLGIGDDLRATFVEVREGAATYDVDSDRIVAVAVRSGSIEVDMREGSSWANCVELTPGMSTVIPCGTRFRMRRSSGSPCLASIHSARIDLALR